jgi:8-oxo-dGTP diphosphatase
MALHQPVVRVAVDNCIFAVRDGRLEVLLIQMKKKPFDFVWALPGGLMQGEETLDEAAARILELQTGVRDVYLEQLYTFDDRSRDPDGRVISVAYVSLIPWEGHNLETTDKYRAVEFWDCDRVPAKLAYDHREILDYARNRLEAKIQYTNCAWSLLPERFTLSELQVAYETVLNRSLDKRNFRKKVLSLRLVKPSGEKSSGGRHRPAMLYSFESREPQLVGVF